MKKLLFAAIIGASFSMVACGESTTTTAKDSVTTVVDSTPKMAADTMKKDTTVKVDSVKVDSTKK